MSRFFFDLRCFLKLLFFLRERRLVVEFVQDWVVRVEESFEGTYSFLSFVMLVEKLVHISSTESDSENLSKKLFLNLMASDFRFAVSALLQRSILRAGGFLLGAVSLEFIKTAS